MFDPLTSSIRSAPPRCTVVGHRRAARSSGCAMPSASKQRHPRRPAPGTGRRDARRRNRQSRRAPRTRRALAAIPQGEGRTRGATLDGEPDLRAPQQECRDRGEQLVAPRVQQIDQAPQLHDPAGRRHSRRLEALDICRSRGALNASRSNRAKTPASSARSWAGASTPARMCERAGGRPEKTESRRPQPARRATVPRLPAPRQPT